jgi:hypothetical protein
MSDGLGVCRAPGRPQPSHCPWEPHLLTDVLHRGAGRQTSQNIRNSHQTCIASCSRRRSREYGPPGTDAPRVPESPTQGTCSRSATPYPQSAGRGPPLPAPVATALKRFSGGETGRIFAASAQWPRATHGALSLEGPFGRLVSGPSRPKAGPRSDAQTAGPARVQWGRRARATRPCGLTLPRSPRAYAAPAPRPTAVGLPLIRR